MSSLSNTSPDTNFASLLNSIRPATLSKRIQDVISSTPNNDDGNDGPATKIHMIMGNEAGDADSIISALGLGYAQSLNFASDEGKKSTHQEVLLVPIVSIPREDISLRRDVILLFDLAGIDAESLLYLDDNIVTNHLLPPAASSTPSSTLLPRTLTLVDHNRIRSSLSHLSSLVTEIVDHHEDEKSHEDVTANSGKRSIAFEDGHATVSSTCTLVAERLFQRINSNNLGGDQSTAALIDGSLGLLLLGVILLDSVNMLPAAGKGTERDEEAMQMLLKGTDWTSCETITPSLVDAATLEKIFPNGRYVMPDRTALFEVLSGAKNDPQFWGGLSVVDCLRIDYKKFLVSGQSSPQLVSSIGLSSVLTDMDSLLAKDNFRDELVAFVSSSNVDLFGILTLKFQDGKAHRELLLAGFDLEVVNSFANHLLNHPDAAFLEIIERKECMGDRSDAHVRVFRQGNGKGSRKQVAPILLGHASTVSHL